MPHTTSPDDLNFSAWLSTGQMDAATLAAVRQAQPVFWANPQWQPQADAVVFDGHTLGKADMDAAYQRLQRWAPLLAQRFPELAPTQGHIASPLSAAPAMAQQLGLAADSLWLQCDHALPVAGSIKARGGFHEVLEHAERVAQQHGLWQPGADMAVFLSDATRQLFARHEVAVGSTGNLGMSIGIMAAALGFQATVHMSVEAKEWKKDRLRQRDVQVIEHTGDYAQAVAQGRAQAAANPLAHFVDDERSRSLFDGYSAAAIDFAAQLQAAGITVDAAHPLFVHLPCGVGGAPAGVAWGLRQVLGAHVHAVFMEPVQSPCVLLGMAAPDGAHPTVYDLGLHNQTEADGLAVPQASELAVAAMRQVLAACGTVTDERLLQLLYQLEQTEGLRIEPSAAAGLAGPALLQTAAGQQWLQARGLLAHWPQARHVAWTTGGLLVPPAQYTDFHARGQALSAGQS